MAFIQFDTKRTQQPLEFYTTFDFECFFSEFAQEFRTEDWGWVEKKSANVDATSGPTWSEMFVAELRVDP